MPKLPTARIVKKCPPIEISRYYKELRLQGERICARFSEDITGSAPSLTMRASSLLRWSEKVVSNKDISAEVRRQAMRDCRVLRELLDVLRVVSAHRRWEHDRREAGQPV